MHSLIFFDFIVLGHTPEAGFDSIGEEDLELLEKDATACRCFFLPHVKSAISINDIRATTANTALVTVVSADSTSSSTCAQAVDNTSDSSSATLAALPGRARVKLTLVR